MTRSQIETDHRGTGRTTRAITAALDLAWLGEYVVYVTRGPALNGLQMAQAIEPDCSVNRCTNTVVIGAGRLWFVSDDAFTHEMVAGVRCTVIMDHAAKPPWSEGRRHERP